MRAIHINLNTKGGRMTRSMFETGNVWVTLVGHTAIYVRLMQGMYGTCILRAMLISHYANCELLAQSLLNICNMQTRPIGHKPTARVCPRADLGLTTCRA